MIAPDLDSAIARLQELVHVAGSIVPFTGAGISTECGIPDFRSPGGLWTKNRPIPFDEFISSQEARNESWRRRFAMEEQFAAARPGRGHRAIASLYDAGNGCAPDCPSCGGHIKTATVSFGQAMPDAAVRRAQDLAQSCDLLVSIGSSLVVWPAAGLPLLAKRSGAMLVIINREPTDFDEIADLVVREDIGTVLEPFTAAPSAA